MIQRTSLLLEARDGTDASEPDSWKSLLAGAIRSPRALLERLSLAPEHWGPGADRAHELFPVFVPEPYLSRIRVGDPRDPLLLQILPVLEEARPVPGFIADPLDEASHTPSPGLIRKYHNRALLVLTGACAVNCRYCFRRQFPYADNRLDGVHRGQALALLADAPEINEVILSGGDPLVRTDESLRQLIEELAAIPHIKRLRIHTRLPVVIPQRVTPGLLQCLADTRLQTVMVLHINHPQEIDSAVSLAAHRIRRQGVTLLNQSVLLASVNADVQTLCELSEQLFEAGILPYYLHCLDPVSGAGHFRVDDKRARLLAGEMLKKLPGFLVPRLVREIPGRQSKIPLDLGLA